MSGVMELTNRVRYEDRLKLVAKKLEERDNAAENV